MRFAVISDIHGNLPALETVLEDAGNNNVDNHIFAGDYCLSNPYPNECIQRMRDLKKKHIIRGNEEKYLENLIGKDQTKWTDGRCKYHITVIGLLVLTISIFCCRCQIYLNLHTMISIYI